MLIVRKTENRVTVELPKTVIDDASAIDEIIQRLKDAQEYLVEYRRRRLEESLQPLWEDHS